METVKKLLLASSAVPIIFGNENVDGNKYCDGGIPVIGDNVPIKPVYDLGVDIIVVIHLSRNTLIDKQVFPDADIIEIVPQVDLGGPFAGTLDFTAKGSEWRIEQGYKDAQRIFEPMIQMITLNSVNQKMLTEAKRQQYEFAKKKKSFIDKEADIEIHKKQDGFDDLYKTLIKKDIKGAISDNERVADYKFK